MKQKSPGLDHWIVSGLAGGERPFTRVIFIIDEKIPMTFLSLCGFSLLEAVVWFCFSLYFFSPIYLGLGIHLGFKLLL